MTAVSAEASGARGAPSGNPDVPEAGQLVVADHRSLLR